MGKSARVVFFWWEIGVFEGVLAFFGFKEVSGFYTGRKIF
jgi:hypothetical protein